MFRVPDWLIYAAVVLGLLWAALAQRENADAPEAPPEESDEIGVLLGPATPFDPSVVVDAGDGPFQPASGTAFAVAEAGDWLTARHVVEGCRHAAIVVAGDRAVEARIRYSTSTDVAILSTEGGPRSLPIAPAPLHVGQRAFHPGFPQGRPGETATRLLGRETLSVRGRGARDEPVLAWVEIGRTAGLNGSLSGLSGAPALDGQGRVVGVTIAEAPRRGRIYTSAPESLRAAVSHSRRGQRETGLGDVITVDNYGRAGDGLRRDLRIAQVVCLSAT
jgi:S1-C subfamily serine protease